jgi:hypothetical protein
MRIELTDAFLAHGPVEVQKGTSAEIDGAQRQHFVHGAMKKP